MSDYISTTEAAEMLGVSRVTVFNMIKDKRIKRAIKVGRNYIIPKDFKNDFIEEIAKKITPILRKHDVKRAGIFGSFACGQNRKHSDLDLLIKYGRKRKSLMDLVGLQLELQDLLGIEVDVGTYNSIHKLLKDKILNQEIPIL
jgi:excisionase family DNA binding protein